MSINKFLLSAILVGLSNIAAAQATDAKQPIDSLVTIQSLADAQRKALIAKERELTASKAPQTPATQPAPKPFKQKPLPPPKTRLVHAIYTTGSGEYVVEIVHSGVLKKFRDGQSIDGHQIEILGNQQISIKRASSVPCKGKNCAPSAMVLRVGASF